MANLTAAAQPLRRALASQAVLPQVSPAGLIGDALALHSDLVIVPADCQRHVLLAGIAACQQQAAALTAVRQGQ